MTKEWKSITKGLPDQYASVQLWSESHGHGIGFLFIDENGQAGWGYTNMPNEVFDHGFKEITHWKPLEKLGERELPPIDIGDYKASSPLAMNNYD
jgi:hypothetical protein